MNIRFTTIGSYPWQKQEDLKDIGLVMKFIDPKVSSSPAYFHVIDEHLFFLAAIKYSMSFHELTDNDMKSILHEYQREREKLLKIRAYC